jgi:hypothetical protein
MCHNSTVRQASIPWVALLLWTATVSVRAQTHQPIGEALRVTDADDCIHHEAVVDRLSRWLGTSLLDGSIEVTLDVARHSFHISRPGRTSHRTLGPLQGACADRLDAITLAMALAIDHTVADRLGIGAGATDPPEEEAHTDAEPPRAPIEPSAPAPVRSPERPTHRLQGGAFAEVGAALHVVPGWRPALAGGAALHFGPHLSARLGGLWMSEGTAPLGRGTAHYRLWAGRVDLCGGHTVRRLALDGCAGRGVGRLALQGTGFEEDLSVRQLWVAAIARAAASHATGPFHFGVAVDVFAPLTRQRVHVEDHAGTVVDERGLALVGMALWLTATVRVP